MAEESTPATPPPATPAANPAANPAGVAELSPTVASTVLIPSVAAAAGTGEGGEWDLLVSRLGDWLRGGEAAALWSRSRTPLLALALLVAGLMLLRVYGALIAAIEGIPLLPGLLELAGLVWVLSQGLPRLLRSSDRRNLLADLRARWSAFRGR